MGHLKTDMQLAGWFISRSKAWAPSCLCCNWEAEKFVPYNQIRVESVGGVEVSEKAPGRLAAGLACNMVNRCTFRLTAKLARKYPP